MNVRKKLFWILDKVFDSGLRYKILCDINDEFWRTRKSSEQNLERLTNLVSFATGNVPFYEKYLGKEFQELPVVNKGIIRGDYAQFIRKGLDLEKLECTTTSGSTGTPFKAYRNQGKIVRHSVDNIFFNKLAGVEIGHRLYYFRIWNKLVDKSKLKQLIQGVEPMNAGDFTFVYLESFLRKLQKDKGRKGILAYASTYEAISKHLETHYSSPLPIYNLKGVISMSEQLPIEVKKNMEYLLQTKVVSRYSNMENGFIAQQIPGFGEEYFINHGSFFVEILDTNSDSPAPFGEFGRIVVTDYFNYAMPFIRYDTGDIGRFSEVEYSGQKFLVLAEVAGRIVDSIYNTSGQLISPHYVTNTMWKYANEVLQFQFVQKERKEYELKINGTIRSDDVERLRSDFHQFLGNDCSLCITFVDEIPILDSGKRRKIVQEYYV